MGFWRERILPRLVDLSLGGESVSVWRRKCMKGLGPVVVEPGFGSGLNLPHLPPAVRKIYAVDPAIRGRKLAATKLAASPVEVEFVGLDAQRIPLDDNSCDSALSTFTLCTIPDHEVALAELRRVVKPGGTLHLVEHGAAPDPRVGRWQDRLTPVQRRVADGCHLNRHIVELVEAAGFQIEWSESAYGGWPKSYSYLTAAVATNPVGR